uniref:Uncharacterized protein n=1 Tax=Nelumbo nucifera TaxID=4432 RepID=A0A822XBU9_NELNU|nr:TPA_asm: hypothetical protein HUJ06_020347 [Nelumbo nucifera]
MRKTGIRRVFLSCDNTDIQLYDGWMDSGLNQSRTTKTDPDPDTLSILSR